ncbi:hypothetical protein COBT_000004 [Conglomerata obtusa]
MSKAAAKIEFIEGDEFCYHITISSKFHKHMLLSYNYRTNNIFTHDARTYIGYTISKISPEKVQKSQMRFKFGGAYLCYNRDSLRFKACRDRFSKAGLWQIVQNEDGFNVIKTSEASKRYSWDADYCLFSDKNGNIKAHICSLDTDEYELFYVTGDLDETKLTSEEKKIIQNKWMNKGVDEFGNYNVEFESKKEKNMNETTNKNNDTTNGLVVDDEFGNSNESLYGSNIDNSQKSNKYKESKSQSKNNKKHASNSLTESDNNLNDQLEREDDTPNGSPNNRYKDVNDSINKEGDFTDEMTGRDDGELDYSSNIKDDKSIDFFNKNDKKLFHTKGTTRSERTPRSKMDSPYYPKLHDPNDPKVIEKDKKMIEEQRKKINQTKADLFDDMIKQKKSRNKDRKRRSVDSYLKDKIEKSIARHQKKETDLENFGSFKDDFDISNDPFSPYNTEQYTDPTSNDFPSKVNSFINTERNDMNNKNYADNDVYLGEYKGSPLYSSESMKDSYNFLQSEDFKESRLDQTYNSSFNKESNDYTDSINVENLTNDIRDSLLANSSIANTLLNNDMSAFAKTSVVDALRKEELIKASEQLGYDKLLNTEQFDKLITSVDCNMTSTSSNTQSCESFSQSYDLISSNCMTDIGVLPKTSILCAL